MKSLKIYTFVALASVLSSCNDFIDVPPTGVIDGELAYSQPDKMVNAAYASLGDCWFSYPFNLWPYGDLGSDDCLKGGGGTTDTGYHPMEIWSTLTSTPGELDELWYRLYCNISRCNRALVALDSYGVEKLGEATAAQRTAEVHFLRGHSYFKLVTMFRQIPWIDKAVFENSSHENVRNNEFTYQELMEKVIGEFEQAYNILPMEVTDGDGRANKVAAAAYLAKCYLTLAWGDGYEATDGVDFINEEYMQKVVEYTDVVKKSRYGYLEDFGDIFLPEYKNSKESVFAVQTSQYTEDNTRFGRANWSNTLNGCWGIWSCGWDFHKPSQNLVNAFKTQDGLPMFDSYNSKNEYPVNGVATDQKWDPRLFHTVGMPTFPYKYESDYTMTMENSRTPNTYGYFTSLKEVPQRSAGETYEGSWQETARKCLRWERRLEMAMESSRYFDLRRWGIASSVLNAYFETEQKSEYEGTAYGQYYKDARYTPGKNEFYPIPYNQLYYVPGLYVQNKGYNYAKSRSVLIGKNTTTRIQPVSF